MATPKNVEEYIAKHLEWQDELNALREAILLTGLTETIKWGAPVYTLGKKNIVGMGAFKSYVGLWFFQGALLSDPQQVLINAQEGTTKALRQWRFQKGDSIPKDVIRNYVDEAISNQKSGKEIRPAKKKSFQIPELLIEAFDKNRQLKAAYEAMNHSCKREYAEYISEAKREETKLRRLNKIIPMILAGKGLNDKYRK